MAGVYVHIPFCARRCVYCGFFSTTRENEAARYVDAVCSEIRQRSGYLEGDPVSTVYFGGGTPSRLTPGQIGRVIECIRTTFSQASFAELTVECNPDDVTTDYISELRELGVNRISMGVQTFSDELLHFLGRRHDSSQAIDAVGYCRDAGIDNVSIDLMYGLPGQTAAIQQHDLDIATSLDVKHISSYCLSYEEGSPLERMRTQGQIVPADDDTCAAMYERLCTHLGGNGFLHYEISNFCNPGFESRHNSSYWNGTPYLGVGAGAHSYNGRSRQWNPSDIDTYIMGIERGNPQYGIERLSKTDIYNERIMLSLRTSKGLDVNDLAGSERKRLLAAATPFLKSGHLVLSGSLLHLSESAMFISDTIISSLFC